MAGPGSHYFPHKNEGNIKERMRGMFWAFSEGAFTLEVGGRDTREIQVNRKPKGKSKEGGKRQHMKQMKGEFSTSGGLGGGVDGRTTLMATLKQMDAEKDE